MTFLFKLPFVIDNLSRSKLGRQIMEGYPAKYHWPFVLVAGPRERMSHWLLKHELVHHEQVRRDGWFRFNYRYIKQLATVGYMQIDYEIEAYRRSHEPLTTEELSLIETR